MPSPLAEDYTYALERDKERDKKPRVPRSGHLRARDGTEPPSLSSLSLATSADLDSQHSARDRGAHLCSLRHSALDIITDHAATSGLSTEDAHINAFAQHITGEAP
jgi:hypothetical protein